LSAGSLCLLNRHALLSPGWQGHVTVVLLVQLMVFASSVVAHAALAAPGSGSGVWISDGWAIGRNQLIALIATLVFLRYIDFRRQWARQLAAEHGARLEALQARIRPHFLFNTLNTIASLIPGQPEQAEQATMDLADLLRTGLKDESSHLLSDELDLVRGYLRIESLRLGERLRVEWLLDDELPLDRPVPALLLQPLVENAVIHGIAARPDGGRLVIRGELARFGRLRFVVE
ncbi:MAG: sensor histidine kinase, partial [Wenzhouxiangella sp.]